MNRVEDALHRAIDAKILSSENGRADSGHPWRQRRWSCPVCGASPLGGLDPRLALDAAIAQSTRLGVALWAREPGSGVLVTFCGRDHYAAYGRSVARGLAPAVELLDVRLAPAPGPATPAEPRERAMTAKCAKRGCSASTRLDQSRLADGTWSPVWAGYLAMAGWVVTPDGKTYCGSGCSTWVAAERRQLEAARRATGPEGPGLRPVGDGGAVEVHPDASYRAAREKARATAGFDVASLTPAAPPVTGKPAAPAKGKAPR